MKTIKFEKLTDDELRDAVEGFAALRLVARTFGLKVNDIVWFIARRFEKEADKTDAEVRDVAAELVYACESGRGHGHLIRKLKEALK